MDQLYKDVLQIKYKGFWEIDDIEELIDIINFLLRTNGEISTDLGKALNTLDSMHRRLEWYRTVTMKSMR